MENIYEDEHGHVIGQNDLDNHKLEQGLATNETSISSVDAQHKAEKV